MEEINDIKKSNIILSKMLNKSIELLMEDCIKIAL
jgi:hypothetical protein